MSLTLHNPHKSQSAARSSRNGSGAVWLILAIALLAVAALVFLAPDLPRRLFGAPGQPVDRGLEPETRQPLALRTTANAKDKTSPDKTAATSDKSGASTNATGKAPATPAPRIYADEAKATAALQEARTAYKAYQWTTASSVALRVMSMDVSSATKQRAKDVLNGASTLNKLFSTLNERDELSRNFDTSPALVEVVFRGSTQLAVPVVSAEDATPVDQDPLAAIERQRKTGKVVMMVKGVKDFMSFPYDAAAIESVKLVDLKPIMENMRSALEQRIERVKSSPQIHQSLAWYEVARFAYRNRIDERVTELMDQAIERDPGLAGTVREDRAATLLGTMLVHLKSGNKIQAATYLAIIGKRFADTDSGKQAQAYYAGEANALVALAREADLRRQEAEKRRRDDRLARAKNLGDTKAEKDIAQETAQISEIDEAPVSGEESDAYKLMNDGAALCNKAMMTEGVKRNEYYSKATATLRKAKALYASLVKKRPGDPVLQARLLECGQYSYLAMKGISVN